MWNVLGYVFFFALRESWVLEKASKVVESNLWLNITALTRAYHRVPHLLGFMNSSRDGNCIISLGNTIQCLATLSAKKFFMKI